MYRTIVLLRNTVKKKAMQNNTYAITLVSDREYIGVCTHSLFLEGFIGN